MTVGRATPRRPVGGRRRGAVRAGVCPPASGGRSSRQVRRATATSVRELQPARARSRCRCAGSIRFAIIGDSGRGDRWQQEVADQMVAWRARFPFTFVLMLGDNIYGSSTAPRLRAQVRAPLPRAARPGGVVFRAAIGNHDDPSQIHYQLFNMEGRRYYTFRENERRLSGLVGAGAVLRAGQPVVRSAAARLAAAAAAESGTAWKIVYFHHPLYTSGRYRAGAALCA